MTTRSEDVLFASLTDIDSLERLVKSGFDPECVPTEALRPMVEWAVDQYFDSGRRQAPSREMLLGVWGELLEEEEVDLIDEDVEVDIISSAIDNLRDLFAQRQWQEFIKEAATAMANAPVTTKVKTLVEQTDRLFVLTARLQDRSNETTAATGFADSLAAYDVRAEEGEATRGMTFGLDKIDQHTYGIHPGELAVMAAGPKVGKSYFLGRTALHEWATQHRCVVIYTLENTVEMTMDRIACMHLGINPRKWQRGLVDAEKVEWVRKFIKEEIPRMEGELHVLSPGRGERTPERLIREARLRGAESVLVDQMTHVEHPDPGRKPRHELFNENIHEFADLIKDGQDPLSLLVANQINRAGVEAGKKQDYHELQHMAESSGIERAASWVFALHQSFDERIQRVAKFQILAGRREDTNNWQIVWDPESGQQRVRHEIQVGA